MDKPDNRGVSSSALLSRRSLILGGALLAASATAFARMPKPMTRELAKGELEKIVPKRVGDWQFETVSGLVLPPPDPMSAQLYKEILTRMYTSPDHPPIALLIAYSNVQNGLLQLHRPEVCYPAGGYQLSQTNVTAMDLGMPRPIPVRTFSAERVTRGETVLYWTRVGNDIPTSWSTQRWAVVKANLREEIPDGILVRMSVVSDNPSPADIDTIKLFATDLLRSMSPAGRHLLVGNT